MRAFVLLAVLALAGCPKPGPAPVVNPPDASDAAPVPPPPPPPATCTAACKHAEAVCPGAGAPCGPACNRVGAAYAACAATKTDCPGLDACDPLNAAQGAPQPHGR